MIYILTIIIICYLVFLSIASIGWLRSKNLVKGIATTASCSIIIACRNEENTIINLLNDIQKQDYPHANIEVIIGNDHSTDSTLQQLLSFQSPHIALRIIDMPAHVQGKKQTLQEILKQATGEYLLFTDADCRVGSSWVRSMLQHTAQSNADFSFGLVTHNPEQKMLHRFFTLDFLAMVVAQCGYAYFNRAFSCNAANMCISRDFYTLHYTTNALHASGDDVFLLHKAKRQNSTITCIPAKNAMVTTNPPYSLHDFLQQRIRWGAKAKSYTDPDAIFVSAVVYITNAALVCLGIASIFIPSVFSIFLSFFIIKTFADMLFFSISLSRFKKGILLWLIPIFEFFYSVYITFIPIFATIISSKWKFRKIR